MKKPILLLLMLGLFAVSAFAGPTAAFNGMGLWGTYDGFPGSPVYAGEMLFTASGITGVADGQFVSFCVEADEHVNFGVTYDAQPNTKAWQGGIGGGNPDPLSNATAWLYNNYLDKVYGSSTDVLAQDYQMAIWYLEEEILAANWSHLSVNAQGLVTLAHTHDDWNNTTIRVLNLYNEGKAPDVLGGLSKDGKYIQDCLVRVTPGTPPIVPVPGAILLGGIGVSLVGWLRKRRAL